jgi:hypothetical protein
MKRQICTIAWCGLLSAGVALLGGCGGGGSPSTPSTPPPTPTPCTQSVVFRGQGQLSAQSADYERFTTTATGRLDVILDWTLASSQIVVAVVGADTCPFDQLKAATCNFIVLAGGPGTGGPPGTKPIKVSTANFAAGSYNLILVNGSGQDESVSTQVVLSQGSCAALTSAAGPATSSGHARLALPSASRPVRGAVR